MNAVDPDPGFVSSRRHAFTLVELLVVIGIIALLISVLLPALAKAKESANQVKCLSNMRQIAIAVIAYANDNNGVMPAHGGLTPAIFNNDPKRSGDWITWQRKKDAYNGRNTGGADQNITYSVLAKYMGSKYQEHTTPDEANIVNQAFEAVYRCPSDPIDARGMGGLTKGWYRYSYSMNIYSASRPASNGGVPWNVKKVTQLRPGGQRLLLVCEDEKTIDDGVFQPNAAAWDDPAGQINSVASRHTRTKLTKETKDKSVGNVAFADGHGELMSRKDALRQKYTGNPTPDPAGF